MQTYAILFVKINHFRQFFHISGSDIGGLVLRCPVQKNPTYANLCGIFLQFLIFFIVLFLWNIADSKGRWMN